LVPKFEQPVGSQELRSKQIVRRVLPPGDTWVCERSTLGRIHIETCQIARTVNTVISVRESAMFMSVESQR
jgi:hypothetical protein